MKPYITNVVTPAGTLDLVSLDDVREQLAIRSNDTASDAWLAKVITRSSKQAERYCNRIFAQQGYEDRFGVLSGDPNRPLMLGQAPAEVAGIVLDGSNLDPGTDLMVDELPGLVYRASEPFRWVSTASVIVQYTGGFDPIPDDVQQAVIELCVMEFRGRARDPMLRERETPGLGRESYWIGPVPGQLLPGDIGTMLNPYRRGLIG